MPSIRYHGTALAFALALPLLAACAEEPEEAEIAPPTTEAPAETPAETQATEPPAEIASQTEQYGAAWNAEDPAAVAAFFTEDATVTEGDSTYTGRSEIQERWAAPGLAYLSDLTVTEASYERRGDDIVETGRYTYMVATEDGSTEQVSGSYTHTWVQDADGTWRISSADIREDA